MCAGVRKSCICCCMWFVMLVALAPIRVVRNGGVLGVVVALRCGHVLMIGDVTVDVVNSRFIIVCCGVLVLEVLCTLFRRLVLCWRLLVLLSCLEVYLLPIWSVAFSIFCACFLSVQMFVIRFVEFSILNSMLVSVRWYTKS